MAGSKAPSALGAVADNSSVGHDNPQRRWTENLMWRVIFKAAAFLSSARRDMKFGVANVLLHGEGTRSQPDEASRYVDPDLDSPVGADITKDTGELVEESMKKPSSSRSGGTSERSRLNPSTVLGNFDPASVIIENFFTHHVLPFKFLSTHVKHDDLTDKIRRSGFTWCDIYDMTFLLY